MSMLFNAVLVIQGVLAGYLGIGSLFRKGREKIIKYYIFALGLSSAIWGICFGMLYATTAPSHAYMWRKIGLIGVFGFFIFVLFVIEYFVDVAKWKRYLIHIFTFLGVPLYFAVSAPSASTYFMTDWGMTYSMSNGWANNVYSIYSVAIALIALAYIIKIIRTTPLKRYRVLGRKLLIVATLIVFGMILDTVFPLFSVALIPGSSIMQFYGYVVMLSAIDGIEKTDTTVENMSQFVYSSLSVPVCVFDADKRLRLINDATEDFFGMSRENAISASRETLSALFKPSLQGVFLFEGDKREVRTVCKKNGKECVLNIDKIRDKYNDIIGFIVVVNDVSEQVTMTKKAEAANTAKSTFLANMSHEIRTPMNAVIGFSEILMQSSMEEQQKEYVENIRDSSYSLLEIINGILDLSKIESGKMELVQDEYNLKSALQSVITQIRPMTERKGLELILDVEEALPTSLYGDETRIREVLINLLNNAVKYTSEGSVTLKAKRLPAESGQITLFIQVIDTGIGIREEDQKNIFDAFEQVDRKVNTGIEGTGLGLAIVKGYVALMGGSVSLDSTYGKGSTFTVKIPQQIINAMPMGPIEINSEESRHTGIGSFKIRDTKVLVVDDNRINLKVISKCLECYGLSVDVAESGEKAIALCGDQQYPIVFMDQMMPVMDGTVTMQRLRSSYSYYSKEGPGKIVALTANAIKGVKDGLLAAGFDDYLKKPMEFESLEQVLKSYIPEEKIEEKEDGGTSLELKTQTREPEEKAELSESGMQGVDISEGIMRCGGTKESYLEILEMAYQNAPKQLKTLQDTYTTDLEAYRIMIHGIKGVCYSLGAMSWGDAAKELEYAARDGQENFVQENNSRFIQSYEELRLQIKNYLAENGINIEEEKQMSFSDSLSELAACAADYDIPSAEAIVKRLRETELTKEQKQLLDEVCESMEQMDLGKVINIIDSSNI